MSIFSAIINSLYSDANPEFSPGASSNIGERARSDFFTPLSGGDRSGVWHDDAFRDCKKYGLRDWIDTSRSYWTQERTAEFIRDMYSRVWNDVYKSEAEEIIKNGVNIKFISHSYDEGYKGLCVVVYALVSYPRASIVKFERPTYSYQKQNCIWCGALDPDDDEFHSGTCENCGGPKL